MPAQYSPHMAAVAGLVPCAEAGIRHTVRWGWPLSSNGILVRQAVFVSHQSRVSLLSVAFQSPVSLPPTYWSRK